MNIRPIDLQVILPKTTEVSKVQNATDQQQSFYNALLSQQWPQIGRARQQNVQHVPKDEGGKVDRDGHQKSGYERRRRSPRHADNESTSSPQDPLRGHHIDIST